MTMDTDTIDTAASASRPAWRTSGARIAMTGALTLLGLALLYRLALFVRSAAAALGYRFELDYGEGIVWQQALMMVRGDAYGDITAYPYIVFHYPPVFHALAAGLWSATGMDQLDAGRLVSLLATLATALAIAGLVFGAVRERAGPRVAGLCAGFGALILFSQAPVHMWAPLMRVDMVAVAFGVLGLYAAVAAARQPALVHLASLCFVLAVFTKQTAIAAPVAAYGALLLVRPRTAFAGVGSAIAMGLVVLGTLMWTTDGGFFRHVFLYNINRFELDRLVLFMTVVGGTHILYLALALIVAITGLRHIRAVRADSRYEVTLVAATLYFLVSGAMVVTVGKSGSNINYFIEWMAVWCILLGLFLADAVRIAMGERIGRTGAFFLSTLPVVPLALAGQALVIRSFDYAAYTARPDREAVLEKLVDRMRAEPKPIISDEMVLLLRAGKQVPWEPAIFAELGSKDVWDQRPFLDQVERGDFAFFLTVGQRGKRLFDSRYTPEVADAMDRHYPVKEGVAGYTLHLPASPEAARAGSALVAPSQ